MHTFCRINRLLLWPMAFFLPFWLTFGRGMLGSSGWGTLLSLFFVTPALLVTLVVFALLVKIRRPFDSKPVLGMVDSILFTVLYVSVFAVGFFFVDGGDTPESLASVATNIFGRGFQQISEILSGVFYDLSLILLLVLFIILVYERVKRPLR